MSAIVRDISRFPISRIGRPPYIRNFVRIFCLIVFLGGAAGRSAAQEQAKKQPLSEDDLSLVRVNIVTETRGPAEPLIINGKRIPDYQPKIIHVFPSSGVVMDDKGHVLTFLGYRWVDLQQPDPRVDIVTGRGDQVKGMLLGIDQVLGVAVVNAPGGKLRKTRICRGCEIRGGDTVVAPDFESPGESRFFSTQVLSVGQEIAANASGSWNITINRRLPGFGEAVLDSQRRVLGFVSQQPSREDPMGLRTVAYPIAELLASAEKIIQAGGNIRNGWLGVYPDDAPGPGGIGVRIKGVKEDSPAQKAGIHPQDVILKWNGEEIRDERQFIRLVQESPVGSKVSLGVQRGGKPVSLQATIQPRQMTERPGRFVISFPDVMQQADADLGAAPLNTNLEPAAWAGIETAPLTPQLADFFQIPGHSGVLVLNVDSRMPFSRAGVLAGDVILTVNGQVVDSPQTFFSRLKLYSRNTQLVIVKILRKGVERMMTIQLPLTPSRPRKP